MDNRQLNDLENEYATKDVRVFNALRELRLELRITKRAYEELFTKTYTQPIQAHI